MLNKDLILRIQKHLDNNEPIGEMTYRQLFIDLLESMKSEEILDTVIERFRLKLSLDYDEDNEALYQKPNAFDYGVCWATFAILEQDIREKHFQQRIESAKQHGIEPPSWIPEPRYKNKYYDLIYRGLNE